MTRYDHNKTNVVIQSSLLQSVSQLHNIYKKTTLSASDYVMCIPHLPMYTCTHMDLHTYIQTRTHQ